MSIEKFAAFAVGYIKETDLLYNEMEKAGCGDPDFTMEKRAAFGRVMVLLDDVEDVHFIDKLAFSELDSIEKVAFIGGAVRLLGKAVGLGGRLAARAGGRMASVGTTGRFAKHFAGKGWSAGRISSVQKGIQEAGGLRGWLRMRHRYAKGLPTTPTKGMPVNVFGGGRAAAAAPHAVSGMSSRDLAVMMRRHSDPVMRSMAGRMGAQLRGGAKGAKGVKAVTAPARAARGSRAARGAAGAATQGGLWPSLKSGATWGLGFGALQRMAAPEPEPQYLMN